MIFSIRPYHASDLCALYRICLLTGDGGSDAAPLYRDGELLGHYYVAPYAVFEPEVCFTLTQDGVPCGYMLGARDSATFSARCEQDWFPTLRERYPLPPAEDTSADAGYDPRHSPRLPSPPRGGCLPGPFAHRSPARRPGPGLGPKIDGDLPRPAARPIRPGGASRA